MKSKYSEIITKLSAPVFVPVYYLLICFIVYGFRIQQLGFYWDDFPYTWLSHELGPFVYSHAFFDERPFLAVIYNLTSVVLGTSPLAWQVFAILTRWVSGCCVFLLIRAVWQGKDPQTFWIGLLFLVYPGFSQQWVATIYSRAFILESLFVLSLLLMVLSAEKPRYFIPCLIAGLVLSGMVMFSAEYWFGADLVRPVLLLFIPTIRSLPGRDRLKKAFLFWLPYLVLQAGFAYWRGFVVKSSLYSIHPMGPDGGNPFGFVTGLIFSMCRNALLGGLGAWAKFVFFLQQGDINPNLSLTPWISAILGAVLCALLLKMFSEKRNGNGYNGLWSYEAILCGLVTCLAASFPMWLAGLPFDLVFPYDRFTIPMMLGSALIVTGLLELIPWHLVRRTVLAVLVGIAFGTHAYTAITYQNEWVKLRDFLYEMSWRMPELKPGTTLVSLELPFRYYSDNSLSAAINWAFADHPGSTRADYLLAYLSLRQDSLLNHLTPNSPVEYSFRKIQFSGNTSQTILMEKDSHSCLHVLDKRYNNRQMIENWKFLVDRYASIGSHNPQESSLRQALNLSELSLIKDGQGSSSVLPKLFSQPSSLPWCYYFEKADLERQNSNWDGIISLWNEADKLNLTPESAMEYGPFIEGFGMKGEYIQAGQLSKKVIAKEKNLQPGICDIWNRVEQVSSGRESEIQSIERELDCQHPR
jgi:hypothetical protein